MKNRICRYAVTFTFVAGVLCATLTACRNEASNVSIESTQDSYASIEHTPSTGQEKNTDSTANPNLPVNTDATTIPPVVNTTEVSSDATTTVKDITTTSSETTTVQTTTAQTTVNPTTIPPETTTIQTTTDQTTEVDTSTDYETEIDTSTDYETEIDTTEATTEPPTENNPSTAFNVIQAPLSPTYTSESFVFSSISDIDKNGKLDYRKKLSELGYSEISSVEGLKAFCEGEILSLKYGKKSVQYIYTDKGLLDELAEQMAISDDEVSNNPTPKQVYANDSFLYRMLGINYCSYYCKGISLFKIKKIQDITNKSTDISVYAIYYYSYQNSEEIATVEELVNQATSTMQGTDAQRARQAYDYLCDVTKYAVYAEDRQVFSAYGALVNNYAVCEGYTKAYKLMMDALGIECEIVRSSTHAWNVIKCDNEWYAVDVTNGDYNDCNLYFMMDKQIMYSRTPYRRDGFVLSSEHIAAYGYIDGTNTGNIVLH